MCYLDIPVTILSSMVPAFLFCVGVGDSIHILSIYRDQRKLGVPGHAAIVDAAGITGPPVFFTSITTMTGLLSLNFASVPAIIEMGIAGGVGVMIAWFLSLTLLPAILSFSPRSTLGMSGLDDQDIIDRTLGRWARRWIVDPCVSLFSALRKTRSRRVDEAVKTDWMTLHRAMHCMFSAARGTTEFSRRPLENWSPVRLPRGGSQPDRSLP